MTRHSFWGREVRDLEVWLYHCFVTLASDFVKLRSDGHMWTASQLLVLLLGEVTQGSI